MPTGMCVLLDVMFLESLKEFILYMLQIGDFACFPNHNSPQYITNTLIDDMMYDGGAEATLGTIIQEIHFINN